MGLDTYIDAILSKAENSHQIRSLNSLSAENRFDSFSRNDYLNLGVHPEVIQASKNAIDEFGTSASGSRLLGGSNSIHQIFESEFASWLQKEASLLFSSGYSANLGWMKALISPKDRIIADKLIHASLIDGASLCQAKLIRFFHNDLSHLETLLKKPHQGNTWVITESVFSMDGDIAPLKDIAYLCKKFDALLGVDESHALGVLGPGGKGLCAKENVEPEIWISGLGKALASMGGVVGVKKSVQKVLLLKARSFIYSTALSPASSASALAALRVLQKNPKLPSKLLSLASTFKRLMGLDGKASSAIIPLFLGEESLALSLASQLPSRFDIKAIRPPTVKKGTSRLRFSISLAHHEALFEDLVSCLQKVLKEKKGVL